MGSTSMAWRATPPATASSAAIPNGNRAPTMAACITPTFAGVTRSTPPRFAAMRAVKDAA